MIKLMVRHHLHESKPQGHMRLVLLPIVYNAMAAKKHLHSHPLFIAMDAEMRRSNYWPLVSHPHVCTTRAALSTSPERPPVFMYV